MNNKEIVETIYNSLCEEFQKNIPDEEKEELSNLFKKEIENECSKLSAPDSEEEKKIKIRMVTSYEKELCNMSLEYKKEKLIKDEQFEQINYLSLNAYALARKKLNDNEAISVDDANEKIELLEKMLESVQDFNKPQAKMEVSEAILDLKYASGQVDDIFSLRMGREIQNKMSISK